MRFEETCLSEEEADEEAEEVEDLAEEAEEEEVDMEEVDLEEEEEVDLDEGVAEVALDNKTTVLQNMSLPWESSCIHVKMTLWSSVRQRKTKSPTSTPRCTWKTRSRSGRWMRYSASSGTFIFQSNCLIT